MPKNKGWFRSYDRLIDSPEIVQLSDSEFRLLVSMWCLASAGGTEDGLVPFNARALRRRVMPDNTEAEIQAMIEHLIDLELVRPHDQGYVISRWAEHQFRYESKIPSVRKKREHIGNTSGTNGAHRVRLRIRLRCRLRIRCRITSPYPSSKRGP